MVTMTLNRLQWISSLLLFLSQLVHSDEIVDKLAGKRIVFLGDSITQAGTYVGYLNYYFNKRFPDQSFDVYSLGLASETLSGLSEEGHAGGRFPRPCLFERYSRLLEKVKPEVVFACYGMNCGIYQPLDDRRFRAFKDGVNRLIKESLDAGVQQIYLITPPIYDWVAQPGQFHYDQVLTAYASWEMTLRREGLKVIDLHSEMRRARNESGQVFSKDRVHPGKEGHFVMAKTILKALGLQVDELTPTIFAEDPLYRAVEDQRSFRSQQWMKHIGYHREKRVEPQALGDTEAKVAEWQKSIHRLRSKEKTLRE